MEGCGVNLAIEEPVEMTQDTDSFSCNTDWVLIAIDWNFGVMGQVCQVASEY